MPPHTPAGMLPDDLGFRAALDRLRHAQKSARGAPPYSVFVNRPLGRVLAAAAYRLGLRPDQVTVLSGLVSFAGIVVLAAAPMTWPTAAGVCALLVLGYALDAADGQLARLRGGGTLAGEWLDHTVDSVKVVAVHLAVLLTWYAHLDLAPAWLAVPLLFALASSAHFFGMVLVDLLARTTRAELGLPAPAKVTPAASTALLKLPTDYGVLCVSTLLIGVPLVFVGVYTVLAVATAAYTLLVTLKWHRDVRALDAVRAETRTNVASPR